MNTMSTVALLLLLTSLTSVAVRGQYDDGEDRKCEPLHIPLCRSISAGYNMTTMPNLVNIDNQNEAGTSLKVFEGLIKVGCSEKIILFLCSMYAPMCSMVNDEAIMIPPCKELCLAVRDPCINILKTVNLQWPAILNCEILPSRNDKNAICMTDYQHQDGDDKKWKKKKKPYQYDKEGGINWRKILENVKTTSLKPIIPTCSNRFVYVDEYRTMSNACAPRCKVDILFQRKDRNFAKTWTMIWSGLCIVSTLLLLVTFLMDTNRFRYPERPIIAIAFCYFVFAITHLASTLIGRDSISCNDTDDERYLHILLSGVTQKTSCIATFILSYYTTMASGSWWVVLTITWFLAASHKWSREAISSIAIYCHMFAWSLPAIMTVGIIAIRKVDGDLYVGVCGVGNLDNQSLTWFILVPLFTFLLIGIWFLLAGYAAMCRIRNDLRSDGLNIRKLEKLMTKIGVFSIMYVVPVAIGIGCNFYITMKLPGWLLKSQDTPCKNYACSLPASIANTQVYLLRTFASLFVGTITGTWIWTSKTLDTWRSFFTRSQKNVQGQKPTLTLETLRQHEALAKKDHVPTSYHPVNNEILPNL